MKISPFPHSPSQQIADGRPRAVRLRAAAAALAMLPAALVAAAVPAVAAAPLHEAERLVAVQDCSAETDGLVASLGVTWSDYRTPDPAVIVRTADGRPVASELLLEGQVEVNWDGRVLSGRLPLSDAAADPEEPTAPTGSATFALELAAVGAPTTDTSTSKVGNMTVRAIDTTQQLVVTAGSLDVALEGHVPLSFDLTGCEGYDRDKLRISSQPDTYVERQPFSTYVECSTVNADGDRLLLLVDAPDGVAETAVLLERADGSMAISFVATGWDGPPQRLAGAGDLHDLEGGPDPVGRVVVDLATRKTGSARTTMVFLGGRDRVTTTFVALDGTVEADGVAPFTLEGCEGTVSSGIDRSSTPSGPRTDGPAPAHDAPDAAETLVVGAPGRNAQTGGAGDALEVPMSCAVDVWGDGATLPGHSVWYRVMGTGGILRLDPAGSSFNTVLTAYAVEGDALVEVGCADDVLGDPRSTTTQAPLTLTTVEGSTYYVQVAGYAHQYGRLRLAASAG